MPRETFSLEEMVEEGRDIILELVPPIDRHILKTKRGKESEDSGYRIHSFFSKWQTLQIDSSQRREIHEGLRRWTLQVDLVNELTGLTGWNSIFDIEDEYLLRMESKNSRLDRDYIVKEHWDINRPLEQFERMLTQIREQMGWVKRIEIPELIIILALKNHLSIRDIHNLLTRLYEERHANYFFESASEWLLVQTGSKFPLDMYVQIDGAWRTSLVFLMGQS